ncbi:MAG: serine protease [Verrucomicrobiota bacterium]
MTNIHVIADNPNLKVTTNTGAFVTVLSQKCASDRDLALLAVQDAGYSFLDLAPDISAVVQPGDQVITPGNSEGGGVMLNTAGKVLGIGPDRIEIDNPIYHGNSGGPVFHPKSGKVLGVVTYAEKVDLSDDLDRARSPTAIRPSPPRCATSRCGSTPVMQWIAVDPRQFHVETAFLDQFQDQSRRLDAYLNSSDHASSGNTRAATPTRRRRSTSTTRRSCAPCTNTSRASPAPIPRSRSRRRAASSSSCRAWPTRTSTRSRTRTISIPSTASAPTTRWSTARRSRPSSTTSTTTSTASATCRAAIIER